MKRNSCGGGGEVVHNTSGIRECDHMTTKERQSWAWAERTSGSKVQRWEFLGPVRE